MRMALSFFLLMAFSIKSVAADSKPLVIASFSILADMITNVAGDMVEVKSLVGKGEDIHGYHPKARDYKELVRTKIFFVNGLGLDVWSRLVQQSKSFKGKTVIASQGVQAILEPSGVPDPHAWQDPNNGVIYIKNIERALVELLPDRAQKIKERSQSYQQQLQKIFIDSQREFSGIPVDRRKIITSHDAFSYLGRAYGVQLFAPQGWTTEIEPSASQVARVIKQIREEKVNVVFLENFSNPKLIQQISRETGAQVGGELYSDSLNEKGPATTYVGLLKANAETILKAFKSP